MTDPGRGTEPVVRRNDYSVLGPPPLGGWVPHMDVSVVVPAFGGQRKLDLTLASLSAQSYPPSLMEVVVVDDGSDPPLRLPALRPERTRLVRAPKGGWGPGHAYAAGVAATSGTVVLRLDADVVAGHRHVEAHMRWHHRTGSAVVTGRLVYTEALLGVRPEELHRQVSTEGVDELVGDDRGTMAWIERILARTDTLREAGHKAWEICIGASFSVSRTSLDEVGGVDTSMLLGEDSELAYRLVQRGAVVVPELETVVWHLGRPRTEARQEEAQSVARPFIENRVPRHFTRRAAPVRSWEVPFADVVVETGEETYDVVTEKVDRLLAEEPRDIRVTLVGPWERVTPGRNGGVDDPDVDLRLLHEHYRCEPRVRCASRAPEADPDVPFVLSLPSGVVLRSGIVARMAGEADAHQVGLVGARGRGGPTLVRTPALARARRLWGQEADPDDGVREVWGERLMDPDLLLVGEGGEDTAPPTDWHAQMREAEKKRNAARRDAMRWQRRIRSLTGGRWTRLLLGRRTGRR